MFNVFRCPWKVDPKAITSQNVAERSATILDQWKKKATLYKTNVVLAPLGDDFRYMGPEEFDLQFDNYEKIFKHLDDHPDMGAQAKFGTLSDYFQAVYADTQTKPGHAPSAFSSLSGDFFSYADRDDHYWSGYYTSRPFQKKLDRVLEHNLRSAEIILSLARVKAWQKNVANFPIRVLAQKIEGSRRALALFQHHDGITGTAKDHVVEDYGKRMLNGLHDAKWVIAECSAFLLHEDMKAFQFREADGPQFSLDEFRAHHYSLPAKPVLNLADATATGLPVLVYNSLAQPRTEVVSVHTDWPWVKIIGPDGQPVHSQVEPVWPLESGPDAVLSSNVFSIKFVANMTGVAVSRYQVYKVDSGQDRYNHVARVTLLNKSNQQSDAAASAQLSIFPTEVSSDDGEFTLETNFLSATFSGITGRLKSVKTLADGAVHKSDLEFIQYGTRAHRDKSGAYLFLPDGDARPLVENRPSLIRIVKGPLGSEVTIFTPHIMHSVRLHNSPGVDGSSVDVYNLVDIRNSHNLEVGMRLHTGVKNSDQVFYSDLNGFQMQKRKYYSKLYLQGNVYPMPTMAYLQDESTRVSILSSQSSGVANLVQGAIDVMFDRRLHQDDNRGLGQGVLDNKVTPSHYRLLFETRHSKVQETDPESSFPSLLGQQSSLSLIHPMFVMPHRGDKDALSYIPRESSLLLVRHLPSDCSFPSTSLTCTTGNGQVNPAAMFADVKLRSSTVTSLTMTSNLAELKPGTAVQIPPMEILAVKVELY
ncbi:alpha-mannosidase [Plakobranchus ocellatus]|uniref:Alpha-mannosidase n=1 Tax=Plakobranchus ocellatus TaxID=259542 RepID=A0AAV4BGQ6_9GAST|nr:alpha-mannosidase [Plakobranchus ocellatus]